MNILGGSVGLSFVRSVGRAFSLRCWHVTASWTAKVFCVSRRCSCRYTRARARILVERLSLSSWQIHTHPGTHTLNTSCRSPLPLLADISNQCLGPRKSNKSLGGAEFLKTFVVGPKQSGRYSGKVPANFCFVIWRGRGPIQLPTCIGNSQHNRTAESQTRTGT